MARSDTHTLMPPNPRRKDITNNKFGRLLAKEYIGRNKHKASIWRCLCDCGNYVDVVLCHLTSGHTISCGCYQIESSRMRETVHGLSYTPEYFAYKARERRDLERKIDFEWSLSMESLLRKLFPFCVLCGNTENQHKNQYKSSLCIDHVNPACKGYGLKPGNATVLCRSCNSKKWGKTLNQLSDETQERLLLSAHIFKLVWEGEKRWQDQILTH